MKKLLTVIITTLLLVSCQKSLPDYQIAQPVSFANENWHVLSVADDYVALLSDEIIYPDSIYFDDDILFNQIIYWKSQKVSYQDSAISLYLTEEVLPKYPADDLHEADGYTVRLLSVKDLDFISFTKSTDENGILHYRQKGDQDYSWVIADDECYWLMDEVSDQAENTVYGESAAEQYIHSCWLYISSYRQLEITSVAEKMPYGFKIVINVKKSALAD